MMKRQMSNFIIYEMMLIVNLKLDRETRSKNKLEIISTLGRK